MVMSVVLWVTVAPPPAVAQPSPPGDTRASGETCSKPPPGKAAADATITCVKRVAVKDVARKRGVSGASSAGRFAQQLGAPEDAMRYCIAHPGEWRVWRFEGCMYWQIDVTLRLAPSNQIIGTAVFEVLNYSLASKVNTTWTERVGVNRISFTLAGGETWHDATLDCFGQCNYTRDPAPGPTPPGDPSVADYNLAGDMGRESPSVAYSHTVTTIEFWSPGSLPVYEDNNFSGDNEVRCDTFTNYFWQPGCVFTDYVPTVEWAYDHPEFWEVAQHIRDAQARGLPGAPGGRPLHRTWETDLQKRNRDIACPGTFPVNPGQSCDEYPFASTREGAASGPYSARGVNDRHNHLHGVALNTDLYAPQRIFDGDAFYVGIVGAPTRTSMMVVGDSISHGLEGDYTWRYRLKQHLDAASAPIDFVGPYTGTNRLPDSQPANFPDSSAPPTFSGTYRDNLTFDSNHFAQWGRQAGQAKWDIYQMTGRYKPDYLLVALGFNDLGWQVADPDGLINHMKELITNARAAKPNIRILVANVVHRTPLAQVPNLGATITAYNTKLGPALRSMDSLPSPVRLVDIDTGYDPVRDAYDGLHPNGVGEYKIARAFGNTLSSQFGFGRTFGAIPSSVPQLTPTTPRSSQALAVDAGIRVSWEHSYGADGYWLYQRNVTLNQPFQKLPLPIPADSWTVAWVTPGQRYEFYVVPLRGASLGQKSPNASVVADPKTSSGPTNIVATPHSRYIDLSWRRPQGPNSSSVTGYRIYYKDESVPGSFAEIIETTALSARLNNLVTGHQYAIAISAINAAGEGSPSYVPPVTVVSG